MTFKEIFFKVKPPQIANISRELFLEDLSLVYNSKNIKL